MGMIKVSSSSHKQCIEHNLEKIPLHKEGLSFYSIANMILLGQGSYPTRAGHPVDIQVATCWNIIIDMGQVPSTQGKFLGMIYKIYGI